MQHTFSLLKNSLPRSAQLIWAAWFCFRLNQKSIARLLVKMDHHVCTLFRLKEIHRFSRASAAFASYLCNPFSIAIKHTVKSLQVFVADRFNSYIYESKQHMLGSAIIRLSQLVYGSAHTNDELISYLPCDEEISQGYDQHQAFRDTNWAFTWSYLSTWMTKILQDKCTAKPHTHRVC